MSKKKIGLIVVVCALAAVSVVGAQVIIQAFQRQYLNTGLFSVGARETANIYVSLDDYPGQSPANVVILLLDQTGAEVDRNEGTLAPGQSLGLATTHPGLYRVHVELSETTFQFTKRRTGLGSVEVVDTLTGVVRRIPPVIPSHNPVPGGEQP
jgi:hypothetical protein